jgi:cytochrome c553
VPAELRRSALASAARRAAVVAIGSLLCLLDADAADDAKLKAYGRHLAAECIACHRLDGSSSGPGIPSIIGLDRDTFVTTLKFYKDGKRTNPVMVSVAQSLDEEQMQALAAYFASLPVPSKKK